MPFFSVCAGQVSTDGVGEPSLLHRLPNVGWLWSFGEQLPTNTKESWRVVKWGETEASQQRPEGCARGWEGMLAVRRHQGVCWAGQPASSGPRSTGGA